MSSDSAKSSSTLTPRARWFSLLECAFGVFVVLGHNIFHILPNEVPILFGSRRTLDELAKHGFRMWERRHSSVGSERLICNSRKSFCARFHWLAYGCGR
jgi:hypothetical protein